MSAITERLQSNHLGGGLLVSAAHHGSPAVGNIIGLACILALVVVLGLQLRKRRRNDMGPTFMASPHQRGEDDAAPNHGSGRRRSPRGQAGGEPFRGDRL